MQIPTLERAQALIADAAQRNPGPWVAHTTNVGRAAQAIAQRHPQLDADVAYIVGLLHDIGRRVGVTDMRHVLDGYLFLQGQGFPDAARICLTHSFPVQHIDMVAGEWDCTPEEKQFIADTLAGIEYSAYDRLIQLCDALALPAGFCLLEKRLVDVTLRRGVNEYTVPRWRGYLALQAEFDAAIRQSIYAVLDGVVENTFGFRTSSGSVL
jgi:hypothetical protein